MNLDQTAECIYLGLHLSWEKSGELHLSLGIMENYTILEA